MILIIQLPACCIYLAVPFKIQNKCVFEALCWYQFTVLYIRDKTKNVSSVYLRETL